MRSPGDHVAARSSTLGLLYKKGHLLEKLRALAFSKGGGQNRTPPLERYALGLSKGLRAALLPFSQKQGGGQKGGGIGLRTASAMQRSC
jgi:hypothetical protein